MIQNRGNPRINLAPFEKNIKVASLLADAKISV